MRKTVVWILALVMLMTAGCAAAEQKVNLPESRLMLTLPDDMTYDGPTPDSEEAFAWVSAQRGLEISFFHYNAPGTNLADLVPMIQEKEPEDVLLTTVNGMEMLVYRIAPYDETGMQCIGYVLQDGDAVQEIVFWYATQEAADLSAIIMETIE